MLREALSSNWPSLGEKLGGPATLEGNNDSDQKANQIREIFKSGYLLGGSMCGFRA